ncbi:amino acid/amide ABC transporter membrane protein 2 (HAAT family) [Roseibium hamelinense]|uniref:Amino acid/amide ABC transporter membrane protein 2 (HAAT family) n=2 Tax=Roseibium hamelinense TaxID=150831 RepID=A0A562T7B0_9HYPH|nr:branched-chain amino acid ABC transporter permease [Roseibium hamelinense]TWI89457.1 amino acid/amide ABC transporter membrane protein 2 (HAAT family) [Roseibium hamelinense]
MMTRRLTAVGLPAALFVVLALVPLYAGVFDDRFVLLFATRILIFAIVAVSLDFILGYGEMVSFGHAAYIGLGAYAVGILAEHDVWAAWISFPLAMAVCALFALVTGAISLRTRGVYFIMITLAFGQMAYYTTTSLSAYGGDDGLTMWGRSELFGTGLFNGDTSFYYIVFGVLLASYLILKVMTRSRFGRVLEGAKQNEARMEAIGIDPYRYRLTAFVLAGTIAGLAGALMANQAEFVSPAYMSWHRSGELIVMVILGGMGHLHGAILGAIAYMVLEETLSGYTEHWRLIFGPLLILIVLYGKGGLLGAIRGR